MFTIADEDDEKDKKDAKPQGPDFSEKFLKTRTILLTGEIDKALAERVIRSLLMLEAENHDPIKIFIDSPGGDADAGFAIYDMIRFIEAPVYTIGMGLVASAGTIVLIAAPKERRLGLPNSHYMIHQPSSGMRGVATEIEIHAQEIEKLRVKINQLYAAETHQKLEQVEKDTDRDFWMNGDEAVKYGLISKVITRRTELGA